MNNINMMNAMVVVIENGLPTCIDFMEAIRNKGIENDLKGWWWCDYHLRCSNYPRYFEDIWIDLTET